MPSLQQAENGARFVFSDKAVENRCTDVQRFGLHNSFYQKLERDQRLKIGRTEPMFDLANYRNLILEHDP